MPWIGADECLRNQSNPEESFPVQVSAVFQQVGSEAVAQGVGMDPIFQASVLCRLLAGMPHCLRGDGMRGGMSAPAGE